MTGFTQDNPKIKNLANTTRVLVFITTKDNKMAKTQTQFQWYDQRDQQWHILPCGRTFDDPNEAQRYFEKYGNHITRFLGGVRVRLFTTKELRNVK